MHLKQIFNSYTFNISSTISRDKKASDKWNLKTNEFCIHKFMDPRSPEKEIHILWNLDKKKKKQSAINEIRKRDEFSIHETILESYILIFWKRNLSYVIAYDDNERYVRKRIVNAKRRKKIEEDV